MATTLKVKLRNHISKDSTSPIIFRITKNRVPKSIHSGKSVKKEFWNDTYPWIKKNHDSAKWLNSFLLDKVNKIQNEFLRLERDKPNILIEDLQVIVKKIINGEPVEPNTETQAIPFNPTVYDFAEDYLNIIKDGGDYDRYRTEKAAVDHLRKYMNGKDVFFSDLTVKFLKKFKAHLKNNCKLGERTAINHLIIMRTLFKQAIEEEIIAAKAYPFGRNKIRCKRPQSLKIGLEENELITLEETILPPNHEAYDARNIWLTSYYFAGMRASDVLKLRWNRLLNGRLYYAMSKNLKADSFKIPGKARLILDLYMNENTLPDDLVFPFLKDETDFTDKRTLQQACHRELQRIGRGLVKLRDIIGLEKPLTMHVARHSFATIAGDKIPIPLLQRLYRHSDISTTINYMTAFMYKDLDDALDNVVNFNLKPKQPSNDEIETRAKNRKSHLKVVL